MAMIDPVSHFVSNFHSGKLHDAGVYYPPVVGRDIIKTPRNRLYEKLAKDFGPTSNNIVSFNHLLTTIIPNQILMKPMVDERKNEFRFQNITIANPLFRRDNGEMAPLFPIRARQSGLTYSGEMKGDLFIKTIKDGGVEGWDIVKAGVILGEIPIMVGSKYCNLYGYTPEQLIKVHEDAFDPRGYFIIKGSEKVLVCQDKLAASQQITLLDKEKKYKTQVTIPNINGTTVIHLLLGKRWPTIRLTLCQSGMKSSITRHFPIFAIFDVILQRIKPDIYGYENIGDMKNVIPRNLTDENVLERRDAIIEFTKILIKEFIDPRHYARVDTFLAASIAKYKTVKDPTAYLIRKRTKSTTNMAAGAQAAASGPKRTAAAYAHGFTTAGTPLPISKGADAAPSKGTGGYRFFQSEQDDDNIVDEILNDLFVNVPNLESKPIHVARLVSQHILACIGARPIDNLDGWENKRIEVPAGSLSQLFSGVFRGRITTKDSRYNYNPETILIDEFISSFGPKVAWGGRENISDIVNRTTNLAFIAQLMRINTPSSRQGRHVEVRKIQASQTGYCCLGETPEGSACGLNKFAAGTMWTSLRIAPNKYANDIVYEFFEKRYGIVKSELLSRTLDRRDPILINNTIYGWADGRKIEEELRDFSKRDMRYFDVSVSFDPVDKIIEIYTIGSRPTRPLLTVNISTGKLRIDELLETTGNTEDDYSVEELIGEGVIQFISAREQRTATVIKDYREVDDYVKARHEEIAKDPDAYQLNLLCEVDPLAQFGASVSLTPVANTNQGPRIVYQGGMAKQAMSHYHDAYATRMDTSFRRFDQPTRASFDTRLAGIYGARRTPSGKMFMIAFYALGNNIEDAIVFKSEAIEPLTVTKYITHKVIVRTGGPGAEYNTPPGVPIEALKKPGENLGGNDPEYANIGNDGLPLIGSKIKKGGCIIGRTRTITSATGVKTEWNSSSFAGVGDDGIVDRIRISKGKDNRSIIVKVRVRQIRSIVPGDKFASRYSQKGTAGAFRSSNGGVGAPDIVGGLTENDDEASLKFSIKFSHELPRIEGSDVVPDAFINPAAIPTRMTVGKMYECVANLLALFSGQRVDATTYGNVSRTLVADWRNTLKDKYGVDPSGLNTMIRRDGSRINTRVFVAPCYYQILKHIVFDKIQYRARGNIQQQTLQPVHGRSVEGGLRQGEMERAALLAWGASNLVRERLLLASDKYQVEICKTCGHRAITNPTLGYKTCPYCSQQDAQIGTVTCSFICILISTILQGMGFSMTFGVKDIEAGTGM